MALIANCNRDAKQRKTPFQPADFNPYEIKKNEGRKRITYSLKEGKKGIMKAFGITKTTKVKAIPVISEV